MSRSRENDDVDAEQTDAKVKDTVEGVSSADVPDGNRSSNGPESDCGTMIDKVGHLGFNYSVCWYLKFVKSNTSDF